MSLNDLIRAEMAEIAIERQRIEQAEKEVAELEAKRFEQMIKEELGSLFETLGGHWHIDGDQGRAVIRLELSGNHAALLGLGRTVNEPLYSLSIDPQWSGGETPAEYYRDSTYLDAQNPLLAQIVVHIVAKWMDEHGLSLPD